MFSAFARRLTGGYVLLALTLIVVVVATSSALAFGLYARSIGDAIASATTRAVDDAAHGATPEAIAKDVGHGRLRAVVFDDRHRVLAESPPANAAEDNRALEAFERLLALPRARVTIKSETIVISPEINRIGQVLLWYWSTMLPVGIVAILIAWLVGRRITARAVGPLAEVTTALRAIAAGNLDPQQLLQDTGELRDLTAAYNDVVLRLSSATAQRRDTEQQMRQFIADAGHELRTPLTVVMGYVDVLRSGSIGDPATAARVYEAMLEESRRMRALIDRLILLARLDRASAQAPTAVDLRKTLDDAIAASPGAKECVRIADEAQTPLVLADETELFEAIRNILDNALKYAPKSPISIALSESDGRVELAICDRGPGMEPQDAAHAFDRFYRGANKYDAEGSGLGLAIAKSAAERAGGEIALQTKPGEGTCVTLRLPRNSP
ncbi:MAG: HAMP domain-containing histidine kinase [Candidatus Eremiobacteraeota bacterium]|nr:HAMP domain-containing histidine kinase [Candidatus Eremiobacteraeota bacterium]